MIFEWDVKKAESNFKKHGISFEEAKTVFNDPFYLDFYDPDHSSDEHRYLMVGHSCMGKLLIVSYVERNTEIRLISARRVTSQEREVYENGKY